MEGFPASGSGALAAEETDLRAAARALDAQSDALAAEVADHIHERMPEFGTGATVTAQTRAAVRAALTGFARMLRQDVDPRELLPAPEVLEYTRAYVRRGMPMALLLRTYRLGHAELWRIWSSQLTQAGCPPEELVRLLDTLSRALFAYMDTLTGWVVAEYEAERERWVRSADEVRAGTVRSLLAGEAVDGDAASRALGYELRRWHLALVLWKETGADGAVRPAELRTVAKGLAAGLGCRAPLVLSVGSNVTWAWVGTHDRLDEEAMQALVATGPRDDEVSVAVGEPCAGAEGFRRSHEEAGTVRRIVRLSPAGAGGVTRYRRLALDSLLVAEPRSARRFVAAELGALSAPDESTVRLRDTLTVYLEEGGSALHAAQRLGVHVNTVHNRVRRCEELLERPVRERRLELEAALRVIGLLGSAD